MKNILHNYSIHYQRLVFFENGNSSLSIANYCLLQMMGRYYTIMHNINQIANIVSVLRRLFENERWRGSKAVGWWAGSISLGRPNLQH